MRYISYRCNVEYHSIPKAACTSIKAALLESDGIEIQQGMRLHLNEHWKKFKEEIPETLFSFTFVRHPVDRLRSCWQEKIRTGKLNKLLTNKWVDENWSFTEFAIWVSQQEPCYCDSHFRPQSILLRNKRLDMIGRHEELMEEWQGLMERFGLPPLRHLLKSVGPKEELSPEALEAVCRFYQEDFQKFGYCP